MKRAFEEGVSEIWLTSEDTGAYGRDINTDIVQLLMLLVENIPADKMLRIGMTNPPYILEHLEGICRVLNHPCVYKFLHIPVQSGSNDTLERMNREYTNEDFSKVCDTLIEKVEGITISTDFICGFPGETKSEHEDTINLIKKYKFPVINISQFYPRPGTVAERMKPCDPHVKKDRSREVTSVFESYKSMDHLNGATLRVYIAEEDSHRSQGEFLVGHTQNYSKITMPYEPELLGKQVIVKIVKTEKWHAEGEIVERNPPTKSIPENFFEQVKIKYAELEAKKKEIQLKKDQERKERLKELRIKAQTEAREKMAKQRELEAAEASKVKDVNENSEPSIKERVNNLTKGNAEYKEIYVPSSYIEQDYTILFIGAGLLVLGFLLRTIGI